MKFNRKPAEPWTEKSVMDFGKHKGEKVGDVPASYLLWCADQEWAKKSKAGLVAYVEANRRLLTLDSASEDYDDLGPDELYGD